MTERWILSLASRQAADGWHGEAHRLRATLDTIHAEVERGYGAPLRWRSDHLDEQAWRNPDDIAAHMLRDRLHDDEGRLMPGGGATGTVQAYLDDRTEPMASALWTAGADGDWSFVCNVDFFAEDPDSGARPLTAHSTDALVRLLRTAADAAQATHAQIHTRTILRLMMRARDDNDVGVLTLAAHGITALPDSITAYPCPTAAFPDALVLAADLNRLMADPASLVDDLLTVDDAVKQSSPTSN